MHLFRGTGVPPKHTLDTQTQYLRHLDMQFFWKLNPELVQVSKGKTQYLRDAYPHSFRGFCVLPDIPFVEIPYPINVVNTDRVTDVNGIHV